MLIEFRVENHRSLATEQVLSMRPGPGPDGGPPGLAAALYGANAGGKSNVLAALAFLRDAVLSSHRHWSPDEGVPRDPFAWGQDRATPSRFEVAIEVDGSRFDYGFRADDDAFLDEWLHARVDGERRTWFERDRQTFRFAADLPGNNALLQEVTRPNALFLSVASQHKHPSLSRIYSWFGTIGLINISRIWGIMPGSALRSLRMASGHGVDRPASEGEAGTPTLDRLLKMLKGADTGIVGIKRASSGPEKTLSGLIYPEYLLRHKHGPDEAWLPLDQESQGTQTLFRIGLPILEAIDRGGVLLVDELESSLHPMLAREIVRQFNDPASNPRKAQLIFTTHDTHLLGTTLGEPVLGPGQIWLTEKDGRGATALYRLADREVRADDAEDLQRGYLRGRFGAIPFLGDFALARE